LINFVHATNDARYHNAKPPTNHLARLYVHYTLMSSSRKLLLVYMHVLEERIIVMSLSVCLSVSVSVYSQERYIRRHQIYTLCLHVK